MYSEKNLNMATFEYIPKLIEFPNINPKAKAIKHIKAYLIYSFEILNDGKIFNNNNGNKII